MKFGLHLPNFGAFGDVQRLAGLAVSAEEAGWDGFFPWDHIARPWSTPLVDPWIALAAIAVRTRRVRIGALVTPLPRRRPWKVARETVSLDHLSGGRLVFAAGIGSAGGQQVEWAGFREELDLKARARMLDEGLAILHGLWSGQPFAYQGGSYQVAESQFLPAPVQQPHIPVWIAGRWPHRAPFRRAARWDGVVPILDPDLGDVVGQFGEMAAYLSAHSQRTDLDLVQLSPARPGVALQERAAQAAAFQRQGATWWLEEITPLHFGCAWEDAWPLDKMQAYIDSGPPG